MSWTLLAVAVTAAGGAAAGSTAPTIISRLRQPVGAAEQTTAPVAPLRGAGEPVATVGSPGPEPTIPTSPSLAEVARTPQLAPLLAIIGLVLGAVVGWGVGWTPALAAWTYLTAVCLILGYVDARTRLLPTQLIGPSYAVVVALLVLAGVIEQDREPLIRACLGWLLMGGLYLLLWVLAPRSLGYGDVRLSGLLALGLGYLGWSELIAGFYAGFLLGGVVSGALVLARRASRSTHIPFGPFMMLGAVAGVICGPAFAHWYATR